MTAIHHIKDLMSDHKNWVPAIHHQTQGEIDTVRHTFEMALFPQFSPERDFPKLRMQVERITQDHNMGDDYEIYFYSQVNKDGYDYFLMICTTSGDFVNAITSKGSRDRGEKNHNPLFDIDDEQKAMLLEEIRDIGATYVFGADYIIKETREIDESSIFLEYGPDSTYVKNIPRNLAFFKERDFSGMER